MDDHEAARALEDLTWIEILAAPDATMALTLTAGLLTLTAGALSALQTFGQDAQLAEAHRSAGQAYAKVRTDCELLAAEYGEQHDDARLASELRSLKVKIDAVGAAAPLVPPGAARRALAEIAAGRGALPPALEPHDGPRQQ